MLVVRFRGGLGNQMYQYAFCLRLKRLFPEIVVKTDLQEYGTIRHHNGYEINNVFPNIEPVEKISRREYKHLVGELPMVNWGPFTKLEEFLRSKANKTFCSIKRENILKEKELDLDNLKEHYREVFLQRDFYLDGFWAVINFFLEDINCLRKEFVFKDFENKKNKRLRERLRKTESVSIHIRRGDYVNSMFDVLSLNYYKYAIEYICKKIDNPYFFFFSDDPEYVQNNFRFLNNKRIITWNKGKNDYCDLQLMSMCKHNIIANSTFSQWGALLNQNSQAVVIYPSLQDRINKMEVVQLDNWHRVELEELL